MELIPKIIETNTKQGDITIVRRRYLKHQIAMLEEQQIKLNRLDKPGTGIEDLYEALAYIAFKTTLQVLIDSYKIELTNLIDIEEEYNS